MAEQLLNQQVTVIYWLWKEAIMLNANGENFEALRTLEYISDTVYEDGKNDPNINCISKAINDILIQEPYINTKEQIAREARIKEHRNREAAKVFHESLRNLRGYMQKVGYYTMMNKSWDNRIIPTATMKSQVEPPTVKTYREKMPSELL